MWGIYRLCINLRVIKNEGRRMEGGKKEEKF